MDLLRLEGTLLSTPDLQLSGHPSPFLGWAFLGWACEAGSLAYRAHISFPTAGMQAGLAFSRIANAFITREPGCRRPSR